MITIRTGMTIGGTSQESISSTFLMPRKSHADDNVLRALRTRPPYGAVSKSDELMWIKGVGLIKDAAKRPT
jgi:hypothetical protein